MNMIVSENQEVSDATEEMQEYLAETLLDVEEAFGRDLNMVLTIWTDDGFISVVVGNVDDPKEAIKHITESATYPIKLKSGGGGGEDDNSR